MNFNKIEHKIINTQGKSLSKKVSEYIKSENLNNMLYGMSKDIEEVTKLLKEHCEKYASNAYKYENYVLVPSEENFKDVIEHSALEHDILQSMSILRLRDKIQLNGNDNLYIFSIGDSIGEVVKYNPLKATDAAKTDFYKEMKRLFETGNVDTNEILNENLWYMNQDGTKIYNIAPNLSGYTLRSSVEDKSKILFDKLFNQNKKLNLGI